MIDSPYKAAFSHSKLKPGGTHNCSQNQLTDLNVTLNGFRHQQTLSYINQKTEHFNDLANAYSTQSFTQEDQRSKSSSRSSRSLQSPCIEVNFPDLDNFLKENYQKHAIQDLIRSFVDMEEKLVYNFHRLRKTQKKKRRNSFSAKNNSRSLEKTNELERSSFESEEVINEFLYTLQCFFLPKNLLGMTQNAKSQDFSFSETKPHLERSAITPKRSRIDDFRPNYIIEEPLHNLQHASSLHLSLPVNISKRRQHMANPQNDDGENQDSFFDDDSLKSENVTLEKQMEMVKMIFDLRRQNLQLKKELRELNGGDYSYNSLFYFEKPSDINSFSMQIESSKIDDSNILGMLREKPVLNLLNDQAKLNSNKKNTLIVEKIEAKGDDDKEKKCKIVKDPQISCQTGKAQPQLCQNEPQTNLHSKRCQKIESKIVEIVLLPQPRFPLSLNQVEMEARQKKVPEQQPKSMPDNSVEIFEAKFKKMLELELKIQLVLMGFILKKKPITKKIESSFNEVIKWFKDLKAKQKGKQETFEKLVDECMDKKRAILKELHNLYDNANPCANH